MKASIQMSIDYSTIVFQFTCVREHLIRNQVYNVYVLPELVVISSVYKKQKFNLSFQEKESQKPKYQIPLTLQNHIYWQLNEKSKVLQAFGINYGKSVKFFKATEDELAHFKKLIRSQIIFKEISDFYLPQSLLGKGGSSKVYLVDTKHKYPVQQFAAKCIDKKYLLEDGGFDALYSEIQIMQHLKHDNIIKQEEVYEGENTFYVVLEYLKGKSLHDVIMKSKGNGIPFEDIQTIIKCILEAVKYCHDHHVIHRDLKPENIMFKEENNFKSLRIVDFGLSTFDTVKQFAFPKCGTPGYVAPEVANLKDLSCKYSNVCDIFSIGCIFYKLITSKDLFLGQNFEEILKANKKCSINLDNLQIYRTPKSALDLIQKMLTIDPSERITAAQSLEHEFFSQNFMSPEKRKSAFQGTKPKQLSATQDFKISEKPEKKNCVQFVKEISLNEDEDMIADENLKMPVVPVLKRKFMIGSFVMKKNGMHEAIDEIHPKPFKKYQTSDFDSSSQSSTSPLISQHPSFVHNHFNQTQQKSSSASTSPISDGGYEHSSTKRSPGHTKFYEQNVVNVIVERADDDEIIDTSQKKSI